MISLSNRKAIKLISFCIYNLIWRVLPVVLNNEGKLINVSMEALNFISN